MLVAYKLTLNLSFLNCSIIFYTCHKNKRLITSYFQKKSGGKRDLLHIISGYTYKPSALSLD